MENVTEVPILPIFDCPADPDSKTRPPIRYYVSDTGNWQISYGYNYAYMTSQKGWSIPAPNLRFAKNQSTLILAADSMPGSKGGTLKALIDVNTMRANPTRGVDFRHDRMFHAVFLDGHVEPLDDQSLNQLKKYWLPQ